MPGSRPLSKSEKELMGMSSNFLVAMEPIELPIFFRSTGPPVPVTTIMSSSVALTPIRISRFKVWPADKLTFSTVRAKPV